MLDTWARRLGLRTNPGIFFSAAIAMVVILAILLIAPEWTQDVFADGREWVVTQLGWFFILGVTTWLAFLLFVAFSRYGNIRLGKDSDRPAYSNISWFTMLFAGGIGTVLMFWGVAEPMYHFGAPPRGEEPYSAAAANDAMSIALYHLGLHTWAIFALPGLAFAFFIYRYKLPMRVSSVFYPFLKDRIYGRIGKAIDVFAILGTLFGVAVSIGLGTSQINAGLVSLFDISDGVLPKVIIIAILTTVAVSSIVMGLDKGVKRLSNINIGMATALMLFVFIFGSTLFLFREIIQTVGLYLSNLVELAFWNDSISTLEGDWGWQGGWTVFYWAWTVTWAPFIGIFVARISKGRTIREFVLGVLFAPSLFTLVWFAIFGWSAMEIDGIDTGVAGPIGEAIAEGGAPMAMFAFFESFPATQLIQGIAVVIVAIFFATSSDSASLVVDMLCTGDEDPGPVRQRVFWGVSEGSLAALLIIVAGEVGLTALQQVITVVGLPIFIMVFASLFALWAGLRKENLPRYVVPPPVAVTSDGETAPPSAGDTEERKTVSST